MERTRTPQYKYYFGLIALLGAASMALGGCGVKKSVLQKQVDELQHEVQRLKAENANLVSRKAALDDQLLILEKRAGGVSANPVEKPSLQVVRLRPDDEEDEQEVIEVVDLKQVPDKDEKRLVLSLEGNPRPVFTSTRPIGADPGPLTAEGDNLGIVDGRGSDPAVGSPMELFQNAYRAFSNRNYDEALTGFSRFLKENPDHEYADNVMFWRGECYLAQGQALKAIGEYERLLNRFPRSEKGPSTLYRIGFVYDKMHDTAKAQEYYFKVVDRHPGSDAARKASRRAAVIQDGNGRSTRLLPTSGATR